MIDINEGYEKEIKSIIEKFGSHWRKALESKGVDPKRHSPNRQYLVDYVLARTDFLDSVKTNFKTRVVACLRHMTEIPRCQNPKCGKPLTKYFIDNVVEEHPRETMFCSHKCIYEARENPDSFIHFDKQYQTKEEKIEFLRKLVKSYPLTYQRVLQGGNYKEVAQWIYDAVPKLQEKCYNTATRLYWILNGLEDFPTCQCQGCCNKIGIRKNIKISQGYPKNCSAKCAANNAETQTHLKESFRQKFGVDNPSKARSVLDKINASMLKNNSYGKSSSEDKIYRMLSDFYLEKNVVRQYSSADFPYRCDFYIVTTGQYIEYNGTWTHGTHPFDPNNEKDVELLKIWSQKTNSKYYKNAINVWTKLDPLKREIAKRNRISRIEFWTIEEFEKWLNEEKKKDPAVLFYNNQFKTLDFPYPSSTSKEIDREIEKLKSSTQYNDKLSSAIIRHYCPSIWKCESHGTMSPISYWEHMKTNFEDFKSLYDNRMKYKGRITPDILREGMNIAKVASKVTYLKPMLAKRLITTYLPDAVEIFNPFNGFSGIMLGATFGCGKKYLGQDINADFVAEANRIVSELNVPNATVIQKDVFEDSGEHDSLFCCPPYNDLEKWNFDSEGNCLDRNLSCDEWIDIVLQRYRCKAYLFIVNETKKYSNYIVEELSNKSHISQARELVLKFM